MPTLDNLTGVKLMSYCDAAFAGLNNGGSQVGYIIFLVGDIDNYEIGKDSREL